MLSVCSARLFIVEVKRPAVTAGGSKTAEQGTTSITCELPSHPCTALLLSGTQTAMCYLKWTIAVGSLVKCEVFEILDKLTVDQVV